MFPPRHEVGVLGPLLVPGPAEHLGLVRVAPAHGGVDPVAGAGQRAVGVQHAPLAARLGVAGPQQPALHIRISAANRSIGSTTGCTITEKAPTRAFSWLKAPTSAFTFKTLC